MGLTADELLNRPELFVGVVEAIVKADFGRRVTSLTSVFYNLGASFLAFALKKADWVTEEIAIDYSLYPLLTLYYFNASVSIFWWAALIIRKLSY